MYSGGFICQPFTSNKITSPPTPGVPAAWFLAENYPSVRYTMSVVNQTAGANCTTITTPPARFYSALAQHISMYDLGGYYLDLERQYSSTLFQYRGNCADAFYCRPNNLPMSQAGTSDQSIQGNLPGTCQPLVAEGGDCLASSMCQGWHIAPDYTYNNDQFRCSLNTGMGDVNHPAGICKSLGLGSGKVNFNDGSFIQQTARTYILSAMLIFCLAFLYLWYRRQKARQMQQRMMMDAQGQSYYYDNTAVYLSRGGGVNRQPGKQCAICATGMRLILFFFLFTISSALLCLGGKKKKQSWQVHVVLTVQPIASRPSTVYSCTQQTKRKRQKKKKDLNKDDP